MRNNLLVICVIQAAFFQGRECWLFYSPASETQTIQDCIHLKTTNSLFYPNYCDKLLEIKKESPVEDETTTFDPTNPEINEGWGWSEWSEWIARACPEICGKGCKKRYRTCNGPFHLACTDGKPIEYNKCDALNGTNSNGTSDDDKGDEEEAEDDDEEMQNMTDYYDEEGEGDDEDKKEDGEEEEGGGENENLKLPMRDRSFSRKKIIKRRKTIKLN